MNENARKWLEAMRSGEFNKGRRFLHPDKDSYCALGVACEVFRRETKRGRWQKSGSFKMEFGEHRFMLPFVVRQWLGAKPDLAEFAMKLNDKAGLTLPEIAAEIESRATRLFL